MIPYENLMSAPLTNVAGQAARVISHGWSVDSQPPVKIDKAIPWGFVDHERRSWNFQMHCWAMLEPLLLASAEADNDECLLAAVRVAKDWTLSNSSITENKDVSPFAWYDMAVGVRAYRFAYLFDAAERRCLLGKDDKEVLWRSLLEHAEYLACDENIAFNSNHGFYQIAGQITMGRRFADRSPVMASALKQGRLRLTACIDQQFAGDGVHREHSPGYHKMVYGTFKKLIDSGVVDDEASLGFARKIEEALSWFILPNQHLLNFGDTDFHSISRKPAEAEAEWLTPQMRYWASGGKLGEVCGNAFRAFREGGFFVARKQIGDSADLSSFSYFALNAAYHSRMHKHADDLCVAWHDNGLNILVDSGRYGYVGKTTPGSALWRDGHWYSDPWRIYCESTRAHNTLEFDERNFPRNAESSEGGFFKKWGVARKLLAGLMRQDVPYGSALKRCGETGDGVVFAEAECRHFRSIKRTRLVFFLPGKWLLVFDWFNDAYGKSHSVKQWFHIAPELEVCLEQGQYPIKRKAADGPVMLSVASLLAGPVASRPYYGEKEPMLQGWWSPRHRKMEPNFAFCFEVSGASCGSFATLFDFSTMVEVDHERSSVHSNGRRGAFFWRDDHGSHELRFNRPVVGELSARYETLG